MIREISMDETEEIIARARDLYEDSKSDDLALSPNVLVEGGIAWLHEGLCSHIKGAEEERVVKAILVQCLAAMFLDGYEVTKHAQSDPS